MFGPLSLTREAWTVRNSLWFCVFRLRQVGSTCGTSPYLLKVGHFFLTGLPLATTLNAWKHPSSECCKSEKGGSKCMKDLHFGQDFRVAFVVD